MNHSSGKPQTPTQKNERSEDDSNPALGCWHKI